MMTRSCAERSHFMRLRNSRTYRVATWIETGRPPCVPSLCEDITERDGNINRTTGQGGSEPDRGVFPLPNGVCFFSPKKRDATERQQNPDPSRVTPRAILCRLQTTSDYFCGRQLPTAWMPKSLGRESIQPKSGGAPISRTPRWLFTVRANPLVVLLVVAPGRVMLR